MKFSRTIGALALASYLSATVTAEPVYVEYSNNPAKEEQTTRLHVGDKKVQLSHTDGQRITDKVAAVQPVTFGGLQGILASYGERSRAKQGVGFEFRGTTLEGYTLGITGENAKEQLVNMRGGTSITQPFTAQFGIARKADTTLYQALLGVSPSSSSWLGASTVTDGHGNASYNWSIASADPSKGPGIRLSGTTDGRGNGFIDCLYASTPTFGRITAPAYIAIEDKGIADLSIVDNIADYRPPFDNGRGKENSLVVRWKEWYGSTGSKHFVNIEKNVFLGSIQTNMGAALSWKNSDAEEGMLTPNIGASCDGWNVQLFSDLKKETTPGHTFWFWKEWKF